MHLSDSHAPPCPTQTVLATEDGILCRPLQDWTRAAPCIDLAELVYARNCAPQDIGTAGYGRHLVQYKSGNWERVRIFGTIAAKHSSAKMLSRNEVGSCMPQPYGFCLQRRSAFMYCTSKRPTLQLDTVAKSRFSAT
jgi:hypothetical protein